MNNETSLRGDIRSTKQSSFLMRDCFAALAMALIVCASAQAAPNPLAGSKHDNSAPIEINADNLEVLQEENKAIFTGHVVAIQGKVRLKSDKMTVYYAQKAEAEPSKKQAPADPQSGAIEKIDVEGSVFLSTPEETASGAHGVYDVKGNRIVLEQNVVLTRAKNTLKGNNLVYDFATGKSTLTGGAAVTQQGGKDGSRVRALFVPEKKQGKP